jgi:hypothetical protein
VRRRSESEEKEGMLVDTVPDFRAVVGLGWDELGSEEWIGDEWSASEGFKQHLRSQRSSRHSPTSLLAYRRSSQTH